MSTLPPVTSFDELRALIAELPGGDEAATSACRDREAQLTKPPGAVGRP